MAGHPSSRTALIIGVGPALGAALCRAAAGTGRLVAGLGRSLAPESSLATALQADIPGFRPFAADARDPSALERAVADVEAEMAPIDLLVFNAAKLKVADFEETGPAEFEEIWRIGCLSAVNAAHAVLPRMAVRGGGTAIFTGATASVRGGARFSAFASAKFALRGLAQALARQYGPKGVHVAHALIDGRIADSEASRPFLPRREEGMEPADIAAAYMAVAAQPRTAWTHEFDLRPFAENF